MPLRAGSTSTPLAQNLVEAPRCVVDPPCNTKGCWFCNVAKWGRDWWLR
jgi:hypothetical protein